MLVHCNLVIREQFTGMLIGFRGIESISQDYMRQKQIFNQVIDHFWIAYYFQEASIHNIGKERNFKKKKKTQEANFRNHLSFSDCLQS